MFLVNLKVHILKFFIPLIEKTIIMEVKGNDFHHFRSNVIIMCKTPPKSLSREKN